MPIHMMIALAALAAIVLHLLHRLTCSVMMQYQVDPNDRFGPMLCYPNGPLADDTKGVIERAENARAVQPLDPVPVAPRALSNSQVPVNELKAALKIALPILEHEVDEREASGVGEDIEPVRVAIEALRVELDRCGRAPDGNVMLAESRRTLERVIHVLEADGDEWAVCPDLRAVARRMDSAQACGNLGTAAGERDTLAKKVAALKQVNADTDNFTWPEPADSDFTILESAVEIMELGGNRFHVYCCLVEVVARMVSAQNKRAREALHPVPTDSDEALVKELDAAEKPEWNLEVAVHDLYKVIANDIVNSSPEYQVAALRLAGYSEARVRALFANRAA